MFLVYKSHVPASQEHDRGKMVNDTTITSLEFIEIHIHELSIRTKFVQLTTSQIPYTSLIKNMEFTTFDEVPIYPEQSSIMIMMCHKYIYHCLSNTKTCPKLIIAIVIHFIITDWNIVISIVVAFDL